MHQKMAFPCRLLLNNDAIDLPSIMTSTWFRHCLAKQQLSHVQNNQEIEIHILLAFDILLGFDLLSLDQKFWYQLYKKN
jgi:hypothetical protein